jgi:queuosine precursor transporter
MTYQTYQSNQASSFRFITLLSMLYVTTIITINALIFRMTVVDHVIMSAAAFLIPFWFIIADIITEVYGYNNGKRIIWQGLVCIFIFGGICSLSSYLPVPAEWKYSVDYSYVFAKQFRVSVVLFMAVLLSAFTNSYLLSRWSILLKGKYFWVRCIIASGIGQLIFSLIIVIFNFYDKLSIDELIRYICAAYPQKMLILILLEFPAYICIIFLKKAEGIKSVNQEINFNPFKSE